MLKDTVLSKHERNPKKQGKREHGEPGSTEQEQIIQREPTAGELIKTLKREQWSKSGQVKLKRHRWKTSGRSRRRNTSARQETRKWYIKLPVRGRNQTIQYFTIKKEIKSLYNHCKEQCYNFLKKKLKKTPRNYSFTALFIIYLVISYFQNRIYIYIVLFFVLYIYIITTLCTPIYIITAL